MRRSFFSANATALGLALLLALSAAAPAMAGIVFQPQAISYDSKGTSAHVHTDLDYYAGDPWTASLNGLQATSVFADDCGNLVAKFYLADVKSMIADGERSIEFTFQAVPSEGDSYTETITVPVTPPKK